MHLPAKPERYAELEAAVRQVLTDMSHEPDFLECTLHRSQNDPDTLVVCESWSCDRDYFLQHHLPRHYRADFERQLAERLAGSASRSGDKLTSLQQIATFAAQHGMHWASPGCQENNSA